MVTGIVDLKPVRAKNKTGKDNLCLGDQTRLKWYLTLSLQNKKKSMPRQISNSLFEDIANTILPQPRCRPKYKTDAI
jgi:hypothetical protein